MRLLLFKCILYKQIGCHELRIRLGLLGLSCGELHSNLTQRDRLENLDQFRLRKINTLLATDVAARGLDIKGIEVVSVMSFYFMK